MTSSYLEQPLRSDPEARAMTADPSVRDTVIRRVGEDTVDKAGTTNDCRNCHHQTYKFDTDYVYCSHPKTIGRTVDPEPDDPWFMHYRTGDIRKVEMQLHFDSCACWEAES